MVPGERKEVLETMRLPSEMSKDELTARRQQCVMFMPPRLGGYRDGERRVRLLSRGMASESVVKAP
jgi:hypothetical protein